MRMKLKYSLFLLLVSVTVTIAQNPPSSNMQLEQDKFSFGEIPQGETGSYTFNFVNTGDKNLQIFSVTNYHSGLTITLDSILYYMPDQEGSFDVSYNTTGQNTGKKTMKFIIYTNSIINPNVTVELLADITEAIPE